MCGKTLRTCKENDSTMKQKSQHQAWVSINLKKKEWVSRRISAVCSQIVLKCLYSARVGRPDILWSVNKFARAFTKWTKSCDKRLARLISYIHHTSEYRQCGHVETQHNNADLDCFKTLILQETLKTQNQHQEEFCPFSEVTRLCQQVGCARNRLQFHTVLQKLKSFLSMQVYAWTVFPLSLGFGGWSISFRTEQNWWIEERATGKTVGRCQAKHAQPHPNQEHKRHSNKHWSHPTKYNAFWPQRYVVCLWQRGSNQDDYQKSKSHNEACFTDPQSCPGLVVWQDSFGPQIQIRFDTKHQLADMLTKGNFKRDEWNNLLHLFNISHFSSICCTKNFSLISCSTMAMRIQDQKKKELCPSRDQQWWICHFFVATSSSSASSPIASKSPGKPTASGKPDSRMSVEPNSLDAASTSQVRRKDAYLGRLMEMQRWDPSHREEEDSEDSNNPEAETWYYKEEPVAQNSKAWVNPIARGASSSVDQEHQKNTEATWDQHLHISPDTSHYMEAVFFMVRKICGKPPGDPVEDLIVNLAIWRMFMNTTLRAAVHLGKDCGTNLGFVKNYLW